MQLTWLDIVVFLGFFGIVVGVSMYKSRKEETSEDFFLASRGLTWPLIGLSLIAANISTEHFVGMAGQGAGIAGMAIASYEWMAAITLVFVAIFFLPKFLSIGVYTIPEYLE
ncbi:solute:sodium symporter family transporter, partial [candidate division KSB1 bacterium]|nr:solute:sodium symporter family transporter [candidate division KSB1 bacterium]